MALPFLSTLSLRARAAYPIIRRGVREGLSSRSITDILRANDLGIARTTLLDIMRREKALIEHGRNLRFLPFNRKPNPEKLPTAITKQLREYAYTIRVRYYIEDVGEIIEQHMTVSSSKLLTRREAETIAQQMSEDSPENYHLEPLDFNLVFVQRAGDGGFIL